MQTNSMPTALPAASRKHWTAPTITAVSSANKAQGGALQLGEGPQDLLLAS